MIVAAISYNQRAPEHYHRTMQLSYSNGYIMKRQGAILLRKGVEQRQWQANIEKPADVIHN